VSGSTVRRERLDSALSRFVVDQGAAGTSLVAAGVPNKAHKVVGALLTLAGDGTLKFQSASSDLCGPLDVAVKGGFVFDSDSPFFLCAVGADLNLVTTLAAAHGVLLVITE
jgi:hypothetical protein